MEKVVGSVLTRLERSPDKFQEKPSRSSSAAAECFKCCFYYRILLINVLVLLLCLLTLNKKAALWDLRRKEKNLFLSV